MASTDDDVDDLLADLAEFDDDYEPEPGVGEAGEEYEEEDDLSDFDDDDTEVEDITVAGEVAISTKTQTKPEPPQALLSRSDKPRPGLIAVPGTKTSEAIRRPLMSGHCSAPQSKNPEESHKRCRGYSRANPDKIFQPCPDLCHFPEEMYECDSCGGTLVEAPHYPLDEDGDVRYVHVDTARGRALDVFCR